MRNFVFYVFIIGFFVFCFLSFKHIDKVREVSARTKLSELEKENNILAYAFNKMKPEIKNEALFLSEVYKEFHIYESEGVAKILNFSFENENSKE